MTDRLASFTPKVYTSLRIHDSSPVAHFLQMAVTLKISMEKYLRHFSPLKKASDGPVMGNIGKNLI